MLVEAVADTQKKLEKTNEYNYRRPALDKLIKLLQLPKSSNLAPYNVVVLYGVRRSGKTFLICQVDFFYTIDT